MLKTILIAVLPFLVLFGSSSPTEPNQNGQKSNNETLEKMIVARGNVTMDVNLNRPNGESRSDALRFDVEPNSFFTVLVLNNELRGPLPSAMKLVPQDLASLPGRLKDSAQNLVLENTPWGEPYELVIRDERTGFVFFNIEGHQYDYNPIDRLFSIREGRMLLSKDFADELGRSSEAGSVIGEISITATMTPIEVTQVADGEVQSNVLPGRDSALPGTVPGPDVVVGDLSGLAQFGSSSGTKVGLAVGTDSCNFGTVDLNWFANPSNDHPVIPQNLYRMSGGSDNTERFEQIGQSHVKHAFTALTNNICGLGCNGVGGSRLGSGCSDPYGASLNSGPSLGSRAWINPFTGFYPRNDSTTPNNSHSGHTHTGPAHRILTEISDLNTSLNQGAKYFAEGQYVTPHEYAWCQANPGQCNMYNNVSYRQYNVIGTGSPFSFTAAAATVRAKAAINAWTGATLVEFRPDPGNDGLGIIGYKVTNPSPGVWHYEYAIYNMNIDRAIQSFSVPLENGVTLTNIGFHAPPQHPGWANDGTMGDAGFSSAAWNQTQLSNAMTWATETMAQNQNANAIRWGTMYNFRFDSNRPPQTVNATIGFLKTGNPITVQIQGPGVAAATALVSGRVSTAGGRRIANARVTITDASNNVRATTTNGFGNYRFENVATGGSYTVRVTAKRYTFTPRIVQVSGDLTDVNFIAGQ